tara:strand:- start:47750 stop:48751 length:1002 start_codon:yes stop_codon:yes gene_type:complete
MSVGNKQIGWSTKQKLLWEIANSLDKITCPNAPCTTTTTTIAIVCNCYTISNLTGDATTYSYVDCEGVSQLDLPIAQGESISLCAKMDSLNFNDQIIDNGTCDGPCAPLLTMSFLVNDLAVLNTWIGGAITDVSIWNTFFNLPANGTPFSSASSNNSDTVTLYNTGTIVLAPLLFVSNDFIFNVTDYGVVTSIGASCFDSSEKLDTIQFDAVTLIDDLAFSNCLELLNISIPNLVTLNEKVFSDCIHLITFSFPLLTTLNISNFLNCFSLDTFYAPVLLNLGGTVGNDNVFSGITGEEITITIPIALMTCNAGNPDGDIQYLQANNTVTVITT